VTAPDGRSWFVHFQDKGAYGRVIHLEPMQWKDGWPLIGQPGRKPGTGEPVITYAKPVQGHAPTAPPTSDDFDARQLGPQWQWSANPQPGWYSLDARPGTLRLYTQAVPDADDYVRGSPAILAQKAPASRFLATTVIHLEKPAEGDRAGLIVNGMQYAWVGLRRKNGIDELVSTVCGPFGVRCSEQSAVVLSPAPATLTVRAYMHENAFVNFSYSLDGATFKPAGAPFPVTRGTWVGAQVGLFSVGRRPGSWLDVSQFQLTAPGTGPY
jgi:beta-xylosidase